MVQRDSKKYQIYWNTSTTPTLSQMESTTSRYTFGNKKVKTTRKLKSCRPGVGLTCWPVTIGDTIEIYHFTH